MRSYHYISLTPMKYVDSSTGDLESDGSDQALFLHEDLCAENINELKKKRFRNLYIGRTFNRDSLYRLPDYCPDLAILIIYPGHPMATDVSWISELKDLKHLTLEGPQNGFLDFNELRNLESVYLEVTKSTKNIFYADVPLNYLTGMPFNVDLQDVSPVIRESVETFGFVSSKAESLEGIQTFSSLKHLMIESCSNLKDVSALRGNKTIEIIEIERTHKIDDLSVFGTMSELKSFEYQCKSIPTLRGFLPGKNLEKLIFSKRMVIEDKDDLALLEFPKLYGVLYTKKKDYNSGKMNIWDNLQGRKKSSKG